MTRNQAPVLPLEAGTLPLAGVRVVEFCQVAAGPFCGMLLADFGAEVVKVEPREGDSLRQWPPIRSGFSENFASLNRGKRSIALDLKNPDALELARSLVLEADVLVENNRPGVMQRLGLGWDWFGARKPSLVYCSISAYGQTGPRASEGGFDLTMQAAAGVMSVTGEADGPPVKCGVPVSDFTAGLYGAFSIASLVARVRAGGLGGQIDVPMFATTLAIAALQTSEYFGTGNNPRKLGSAHPRNAPYQAYRARDRWFAIAAGNNRLWQAVCDVVGTPALLRDERFANPSLRAANQLALKDLLDPLFAQRDAADWLADFARAGVPCAPINGYAEALADPQTEHLQLVRPMTMPGGTDSLTVVCPVRLDGQPLPVDTRSPALGEHESELRARVRSAPASDDPIAPLREFVVAMTKLVERSDDEPTLIAEGRELLARLVARDDWLPAAFAQPDPRHYRQYLLHADPLERFSVVSFVWGPGQKTPVHDHTVWGLVGMLRGAELAQRWRREPDGRLVPDGEESLLQPGQVDAVSPSLGDIHVVSNALPDRPSISIHVYGANIGAVHRHSYDPQTGQAKEFVSGYSSATVPNLWDRSASIRSSTANAGGTGR